MKATKADMRRIRFLNPYLTSRSIPVTYRIGDTLYRAFPKDSRPLITRRRIDANIHETVIIDHSPEGLTLRAECTEYSDYPIVEWVMYISNETDTDSPIVSDWRIETNFRGNSPRLLHGTGDTCRDDGYHWQVDPITEEGLTVQTRGDGTSCNGAFPYLRLLFGEEWGINVAVGWTGSWTSEWKVTEDGVRVSVGQPNLRTYLKQGSKTRLRAMMNPPAFVQPDTPIDEVLQQMSNHRVQLAIVRDHNHKTLGVLTVEDILEELVGEIQDEEDTEGTVKHHA